MFQRSLFMRRKLNAYSMFMIKNREHPEFKACKDIKERGRKTAAMYAALPASEKAALQEEGRLYQRK